MITWPEPDPVDFRIREVKPTQVSSCVHTPFGEPRSTQSNIAQYPYPIPNKEGEYVVKKVPSKILDAWCERSRWCWVDEPGKDAYFLHEMQAKFVGGADKEERDPRFMNRPSIFPRSYKFELDCYESRRLKKLEDKMTHERLLKSDPEAAKKLCECLQTDGEVDPDDVGRWQVRPKLFGKSCADPCHRRLEFQRFGLPFKNEACNFYYSNYPTPRLPFRPKKFA